MQKHQIRKRKSLSVCQFGCGQGLTSAEPGTQLYRTYLTQHEKRCPRRLFACPVEGCSRIEPYMPLKNHLNREHCDIVLRGERAYYSLYLTICRYDRVMMCKPGQEMFHVQIISSAEIQGIAASVTYLGPTHNASKFVYEISVGSEKRGRKFVYKRETHNDQENKYSFYIRGDSFFIPYKSVIYYLTRRFQLNLSVLITPLDD